LDAATQELKEIIGLKEKILTIIEVELKKFKKKKLKGSRLVHELMDK